VRGLCAALFGLLCATLMACGTSGVAAGDPPCELLTSRGNVVVGSGLPGDPAAPEAASGYRVGSREVGARSFMLVTANPLASKAGCEVLRKGGSAVDAAVAAQAVLGLVEPQSSGLGGGAFLMHYDATHNKVLSYDGRETAPAAATADDLRWIDAGDRAAPKPSPRASGRSIGTPGVMRMLELAHADHGKLPWKDLFAAGIELARDGFPISGRMAAALDASKAELARDADAAAAYLNADGSARALGSHFRLPSYADTLQTIAEGGADVMYRGAIAQAIVAKIGSTSGADGSAITPGRTTLEDLARYRAKKREPVCLRYRSHWVCGMGPPSSGGLAVAQALGILESFALASHAPTAADIEGGKPGVMGVHLVSEAERLAYADRDKYVADTDFVPLPGNGTSTLLDKTYLRQRAGLINLQSSMGVAAPGDFGLMPQGSDSGPREGGTTQVTVVDRAGNVVSMTTTIESSMGSFHMTRGFLLNNQLTDFSFTPADANGAAIANRLAPGKRPRSSMAPTLVFKATADGGIGDFVMATGSPGGGAIIQYVVKTLVGVLDWGLDAQQATNLVNFGAANNPITNVGGEHPNIDARNGGAHEPLVSGLRAMRHTVSVNAQPSGVGTILRGSGVAPLRGGADPRREGLVLGDTVTPAR
jgi:gamma-glutamyltranspeptidase/glutathione hydrolase